MAMTKWKKKRGAQGAKAGPAEWNAVQGAQASYRDGGWRREREPGRREVTRGAGGEGSAENVECVEVSEGQGEVAVGQQGAKVGPKKKKVK